MRGSCSYTIGTCIAAGVFINMLSVGRYTAALKFHRNLHWLVSFTSPSENELHLVYAARSPPASRTWRRVTIILLFVPNTRQLADVQVSGLLSDSDMSDVIGAHIQANDVVGVIAAVLQRARGRMSSE